MINVECDFDFGFTQTPNDFIISDLTDGEFRLLIYLMSKSRRYKIRQENVAKDLGVAIRTISQRVAKLKEKGYLMIEEKKNKNGHFDYKYTVTNRTQDIACRRTQKTANNRTQNSATQKTALHTNTNSLPILISNTNTKKIYKKVFTITGEEIKKVKVTEEEYLKLIDDYEEKDILELIEKMENWILSKGKSPYKNHYRALLNWITTNKLQKKKNGFADLKNEYF